METLWFPQLSIEIPSDREVEDIGWLGNVSPPRRWIGARQEDVLKKYSMTVTNFKYEWSMRASNDDLRRDRTGQLSIRAGEGGQRFATHWNSLGGTLVTNGEAGVSGLAYDGQFFFDTDHNESGADQTNDLTSTEVPSANVADAAILTTTEAANVITETLSYMMTLTDDKGEPINQGPTNVTILCTKQGHFNGLRTAIGLNNLGTGSGNNNPMLAWNDYPVSVRYVPTRITAANKLYFFFGTPGIGNAPFVRTEELSPQSTILDDTHNTDSQVFGVHANRGVAYGLWSKAALVALS